MTMLCGFGHSEKNIYVLMTFFQHLTEHLIRMGGVVSYVVLAVLGKV